MNEKQKILVTGSSGQLGKELQQLASAYTSFEFIFLSRKDLPLQNFELLRNSFQIFQPNYLINCAAYTAVDKAETEKELAFQINGEAVGVLAALCLENNCRFIHVSTDYVFDGLAITPYKEDDITAPQSVYGASKLEGEVEAFKNNSHSIIVRTSWVYSSFGKNFVKTMLKLMSERHELNVVNDQVGSPTYAGDLAETIMMIIERLQTMDSPLTDLSGIYHYSNDGIISWYDFAKAIKEFSGSICNIMPIPTSQYPTPAKRPGYSVLDKSKIQQAFKISIKDWKQSLGICLYELEKSQ